MSLQSFSQKGTNDSIVILPKKVVVAITKDLERYDLCRKEALVKDGMIMDYKQVITLKDSVIYKLDSNQSVYKTQISNWESTDSIRGKQVLGLQDQVKKFKKQRNGAAILGVALTILAIIVL
jgi:hypothetical protein